MFVVEAVEGNLRIVFIGCEPVAAAEVAARVEVLVEGRGTVEYVSRKSASHKYLQREEKEKKREREKEKRDVR